MTHENLIKAKQKMEIIQTDKAQVAHVRTRIKFIEEGDETHFLQPREKLGKEKVIA